MICANCKNEIGERTECHLCGYDPVKDSNPNVIYSPIPLMPPIEVAIKKGSNGMATAGLILSFFSWYPIVGILSLIFSILGLKNARKVRSGHLRATLGLVFTVLFFALFVFLVIYYTNNSGI